MSNSKPDYIDIDKDGDKSGPMKEAAQNFKDNKMKEVIAKRKNG